ncbi:MAG TPA: YeeE/YedE family protein [Croceibacterium sp.]|nr:YeeE/YedE family protein [Croceibacterium sp.]
MRHALPGLVVGVLFGAGLALSGMTNPARVLGFLDIGGHWDPTLAFVLAAALVPSTLAYLVVRRMKRPVMAEEFCIPQNRTVEARLLTGGALFGIGWGLVGLCPGPALASLVFGAWQIWIFVAAMIAGMWLQRLYADLRDHRPFHFTG